MRSVSKMIRAKKILDLDKKITDGTIVIASDIHIPFQDKAAVKAFLSYVKERQPEVIVLNGDVLDMFMLSRFTKGEGRNPLEEIKMCQALLGTLRSTCPNSEIFYVIGNHECFDKRTEVLTPDKGWVNIKDAVEGKIKLVTSYNMKTGKLEASEVTHHHQSYCSELISIETWNTKQVVTPNHEVLIMGKKKVPAYLLTKDNLHKKILPYFLLGEDNDPQGRTPNDEWAESQNKIDVVPYDDFTYCLTTKLGTLVTRIDGKVAITGNCRLEKYVLNKAPELASLIEDVFSIIKVDDFKVRGCSSLTINDNFVMKHGTYIGNKSGLSAIKEMENAYMSGATGHVHRLSTYRARKAGRKFVWIETGCLCDLNPEYCINPNWCQGFAVVEFKDGKLYKADCLEIEKGKIL